MDGKIKQKFWDSVERELSENLIPFWMMHAVDHHYGGFIGRMTNDLLVKRKAPKGLVLNARILWTFSALYRYEPKPEYLQMAQRAFEYLTLKFQDTLYGGYYWMLSYCGESIDVKKKIYGQAFMIYALSEYVRATGEKVALNMARELFKLIEKRCRDRRYLGYFESYNRDWIVAEDYRLSEKDMNEKKSMNAHLHLLESYTNLFRIWKDKKIESALRELIAVFLKFIIDPQSYCFRLFFNEKWIPKTHHISFGHDIEGSWLLTEAVEVLNDRRLHDAVVNKAIRMAEAVRNKGLDNDGGLLYEGSPECILDDDKHWWPQAEAVVSFLNAYQLSGDTQYFDAAYQCWQFIEEYIVDKKHGEWYWKVSREGKRDAKEYKISEWKGPYHNVRACLEILKRLDSI